MSRLSEKLPPRIRRASSWRPSAMAWAASHGLPDAGREGLVLNSVVADAHELGLGARILAQYELNGRVPEKGAHGAVERARRTAALDVAENGESDVLGHAAFEDFADGAR